MSYNTVSRESTVGEEQGEQAALVAGSARSAASGRAGRQRLVLGCLGFLMEMVCYADRTNISLAILPMAEERGYKESTTGFILSSFFIGYACTQVLGGWASKTYGGKPVLGCGVFFWSLATALTPIAARTSLPVLIAVRIGMGVAEGISLPTMHQLTACWVPPHERSRFVAFVTSGQYVGTVGAMLCSPMVAESWPSIFYLFASIGFAWCLVWYLLASSTPEQHPRISAAELRYIQSAINATTTLGSPGSPGNGLSVKETVHTGEAPISVSQWKAFCSAPPMIAIVVAHFGHNWTWYLLLSWLPKYLHDVLGIELKSIGFAALLPYIVPFIFANVGGMVADWIIALPQRHTWATVAFARKLCQGIDFIGGSTALLILISLDTSAGTLPSALPIALLSLSLACASFGTAGYWANVIDIGPSYAGPLLGLSNTVATLPGILANLVAGWQLETNDGDYTPVFGTAIVVNLLACAVFTVWARGEVIFS